MVVGLPGSRLEIGRHPIIRQRGGEWIADDEVRGIVGYRRMVDNRMVNRAG